jgi:hypothetical protein
MTAPSELWHSVPGADGVVAPFRAVEGTKMKRVTQFDFYTLGITRALSHLQAGDRLSSYRNQLGMCWFSLNSFCNDELNQTALPKAVEEAERLRVVVNVLGDAVTREPSSGLDNHLYINANGELTENAQKIITRLVITFETALKHGLEGLPTYTVERIGIYDADYLLAKADEAFPADLRPYIPAKTLDDFKKAGACLAFELYTATGFHGFRAVDGSLRSYCSHFTGGLPRQRDWGSFISEIRKIPAGSPRVPNTRTVELIDCIRTMDRNPLIHPETDLDALQANTAFDLCRTAITFMALDIKNAP